MSGPCCLAHNRDGCRFCAECGAPLPFPRSSCGVANVPAENTALVATSPDHPPAEILTRSYLSHHDIHRVPLLTRFCRGHMRPHADANRSACSWLISAAEPPGRNLVSLEVLAAGVHGGRPLGKADTRGGIQ